MTATARSTASWPTSRALWAISAAIVLTLLLTTVPPRSSLRVPPASQPSAEAAAVAAAASPARASELRFYHLTDWHLNLHHLIDGDVLDMCRSRAASAAAMPHTYGHFNCDPGLRLAGLAAERVADDVAAAPVVLLGGDSHGHVAPHLDGASALSASHRAARDLLEAAFRTRGRRAPRMLPVVGNHDTWPYFDHAAGRATREELARIHNASLGAIAAARFISTGCYSVRLASKPTLHVLALDTNAFALSGADAAGSARAQLRWLERALSRVSAGGGAALLFGHIAPGASHVDFASMSPSGWVGGGWRAEHQASFASLLQRHAASVVAGIFGHLHTGSVRLLRGPCDSVAGCPVLHISPSLTPRNPTPHVPALRRYDLDAPPRQPWHLLEVTDRYLDAAVTGRSVEPGELWRTVALRDTLGVVNLGAASISGWLSSIRGDDNSFARHMSAQRCANEIESDYARCKAAVVCAIGELEQHGYDRCLRDTVAAARPPQGWLAATKRKPP